MDFLVGLMLGVVFVSPFVVCYALFIRWVDRFEPEPWWLLVCAFLWGALFATLGGGLSSAVGEGVATAMTGAHARILQKCVMAAIDLVDKREKTGAGKPGTVEEYVARGLLDADLIHGSQPPGQCWTLNYGNARLVDCAALKQ